jgi:hypothetical protein
MRRMCLGRSSAKISVAITLTIVMAACGGSSMQPSSSNSGGSGTTPPPSSSNPAPGGSGSGGGSSSSPYYIAALASSADSSIHGQITLSDSGTGTVQLQNAAASTPYNVKFCLFPNGTANCFSVGSVTTDASGNVQSPYTFGKSGIWVGVFSVQPASGGTSYGSTFPNPSTESQYRNPLQRAGTITGGLPSFWGPAGTDPLTSGMITINGTTAQITLKGAAPKSSYVVSFCANSAGSSCFADLGTVMTDSNGNGTGTAETNGFNPPPACSHWAATTVWSL